MPHARSGLSTASVYPENCATAFELAARLGYDGVEVMVWTDPVTREAGRCGARPAPRHPRAVRPRPDAPRDPAGVGDRPVGQGRPLRRARAELGRRHRRAPPPFRWQRDYARDFVDGVALRESDTGIRLAVENMFPWRGPRTREIEAYLPHWDPVPQPYDHVTLDLSHTATAGSDALAMVRDLGPRLTHLHLADGVGSPRDEHLVPGRGTQPCGEVLETLAAQGVRRPRRRRGGHAAGPGRRSASSTSPSRSPSPGCTSPPRSRSRRTRRGPAGSVRPSRCRAGA